MHGGKAGGSGVPVAVVGAGVGGLAAAVRLSEAGYHVTVIDPSGEAGGLAGGFSVGGGSVERFYHHLFRSDATAARWITDLGLGDRLEFLPADMGFYSGGRLHRFGTPLSLMRFSPLPVLDRIRLGLRIRSLANTPDPEEFEDLTAVSWLERRASAAELEVFWEPLLSAKFGDDRDKVSMAWLWARFRARVGDSAGRSERLGYLRGGFQQLGDAMASRASGLGAELALGVRVSGITIRDGSVAAIRTEDGREREVAGVVWTPALTALARAVPELPASYRASCERVMYHHAVVMVVELEQPALPYYWVTVGDDDLPFTVAVEHTRMVGTSAYSGRTIVYLGRYVKPDDALLKASETEISELFLEAAARAFSSSFLSPAAVHVFRAPNAQPIVPPGWAEARPAVRSGVRGLMVANMAQIYPWDRGINYSIELGESAAAAMAEEAQ
ncbi:MAG TPA: FAD-dependent oxidoreductase [Candidatus Solibacter sp.]|jgi:protoporphyrinogen oxidase|nr:FAD-dependent oxidoreductase [Candidatus Solibacter sp.]